MPKISVSKRDRETLPSLIDEAFKKLAQTKYPVYFWFDPRTDSWITGNDGSEYETYRTLFFVIYHSISDNAPKYKFYIEKEHVKILTSYVDEIIARREERINSV